MSETANSSTSLDQNSLIHYPANICREWADAYGHEVNFAHVLDTQGLDVPKQAYYGSPDYSKVSDKSWWSLLKNISPRKIPHH
jgi:hypothetical protein